MWHKRSSSTILQLPANWSGFMVTLGLVLTFVISQVEDASSAGWMNLTLPVDKASSQFWYDSYIHISPANPTPNDVIQITVGGMWPNACTPKYQAHQIIGNEIRIHTVNCFPCACAWVITSWSFTVEIGPLPTGLYTIKVYGPARSNKSFTVATDRVYLPLIQNN